jgi:hypothetical protein
MQKFMCTHSLQPQSLTFEQVQQVTQAAQHDPDVRGYRSFLNLTEGKIICVIEAPSKEKLGNWFKKMGLPYDSITAVEIEGDRGSVMDLATESAAASIHA